MVLVRNDSRTFDLSRYINNALRPVDTSQSDIAGLYNGSDVFYRIFGNTSIETIRAATSNHPTDFLYPLLGGFCNYMTLRMQDGDGILFHDAASYEAAQLNEVVRRIEDGVIRCGQTINSMDKYLNAHPEARTPAMSAALKNLRMVHGMSKGSTEPMSNAYQPIGQHHVLGRIPQIHRAGCEHTATYSACIHLPTSESEYFGLWYECCTSRTSRSGCSS